MNGAALRSEWVKLRTVPGPAWLLGAVVAATVALGAVVDAAARCPAGHCAVDPVKGSLTGVYLGQALVVILAVTMISGEYGTGMICLTLAATPRRTTVLAAKGALVAGLVLVAGAVAALGALLAGRLILPGHGFTVAHGYLPLSLTVGPVLRATGGTVLYLALVALLSLGVAAAVRDTAAATGTVLGLLYVVPLVAAGLGGSALARHLEQVAPMTAGLAVQATTGLHSQPIGPWAGLGVLAAWAAAALIGGGLLFRCRDA